MVTCLQAAMTRTAPGPRRADGVEQARATIHRLRLDLSGTEPQYRRKTAKPLKDSSVTGESSARQRRLPLGCKTRT